MPHPRRTLLFLLLTGTLLGCGRSDEAEEVRALRLSGAADSARARAIELLTARASQMEVWQEFARATLEIARARDVVEGDEVTTEEGPLDYLLQAGLAAGAVYRKEQQQPPRTWKEVGRLVAVETARRINTLGSTLASQRQTADYLRQLTAEPNRGIPEGLSPAGRVRRAVEEFKGESRQVLMEATLLQLLAESLPETVAGTGSLLSGQLGDGVAEWAKGLELDADYTSALQARTRQAYDTAMKQALKDLQEFGYFMPMTILENGVMQ